MSNESNIFFKKTNQWHREKTDEGWIGNLMRWFLCLIRFNCNHKKKIEIKFIAKINFSTRTYVSRKSLPINSQIRCKNYAKKSIEM